MSIRALRDLRGENSDLKVEPPLHQPPVLRFIEPIEPRGAVGDVLLDLVGFDEHVHAQDLLAEVPLIQRPLEDRLVEVLELRQRELFRQ